jgi:hypothetical protein
MTFPLVRLVQAGAKPSAPDTLLITLMESPAGALVQRFRQVLATNFKLTVGSSFKLSGQHPRKTVHQRTSGRFPTNYQYLGWCTPFCTSLHQLHQGPGLCARR